MSVKLSIRDIKFIKYFYLYLSIFLITPWYDFRRNCAYKPGVLKMYGVILMGTTSVRLLCAVMDRTLFNAYGNLQYTQKLIAFAIYAATTGISYLTILKSAFLDSHNWRKLFMNFYYIDTELKNVGKPETQITKNFYFELVLKHIFFVLFFTFEFHMWGSFFKVSWVKMIILFSGVELYYEFLLVILLNSLVHSLTIRYKDLNSRLLYVSKKTKIVDEVQSIVHCYRLLGETVEIFNKIFGPQILLIMFQFGFEMVSCLNLSFFSVVYTDFTFYGNVCVANFLWFLWLAYLLLKTVLPMSETVQESRKFIDLMYQMQDQLKEHSLEMTAITRMIHYSKNFTRTFSAAGFFKIKKSIIFGLVSNVATYVIIVFQLDQNQFLQASARNQTVFNYDVL
ncbi:hypothetical protein Zmor_019969 [Zophobas morio]|uniref:Gustatory receptor n=1 Tax=Zophobas morio TaxID=2755281 RepID=A0AA38I4K3_9CUCU|nr:hypothetical protein Zmor_019969 [Zophobas morio]